MPHVISLPLLMRRVPQALRKGFGSIGALFDKLSSLQPSVMQSIVCGPDSVDGARVLEHVTFDSDVQGQTEPIRVVCSIAVAAAPHRPVLESGGVAGTEVPQMVSSLLGEWSQVWLGVAGCGCLWTLAVAVG